MPRQFLELDDGDVSALAPLLVGARFVNISPGVDEELVPHRSALTGLVTGRGPDVPLATWTPGEVGIQHGTGPRALDRLAELGLPLPPGWARIADHPKDGLVLRPPAGADPLAVLDWLARAAGLLCPFPIGRRWQAVVHHP